MDKEHLIFYVVKIWADHNLSQQLTYLDDSYFFSKCEHPDLEDARCLYRMITKEVDAHNQRIQTKRTLLRKLKYKEKYIASNIFANMNIPLRAIEKIIDSEPGQSPEDYHRLISRPKG